MQTTWCLPPFPPQDRDSKSPFYISKHCVLPHVYELELALEAELVDKGQVGQRPELQVKVQDLKKHA